MKLIRIPLFILMVSFLVTANAQADQAKEIMEEVDRIARESSSSVVQKIKLMTCTYGKKGKKTVCTKKPRIKLLESAQKDVGVDGKDSKAISFILEPIGEKGMGMLSFEFDDPDKDTINWLYLSAMGKVKKIVSGESEDDEGSSFFGSEFLLEDMENAEIEDYQYKLLKEGNYGKRPVWVIEAIPTKKRLRKTKYGKSKMWIDRERKIVLMTQLFDKRMQAYKQISMSSIEKINGIWTAKSVLVRNLKSKRMSIMKLESIRYNVEISEQFLTQRSLVDFAYRERELNKLRQHL